MTTRRLHVAGAIVDGTVVAGDVEIEAGRIVALGCAPAGPRGVAAPGLIDLHLHGCGGTDFLTADAGGYRRAGRRLASFGVTAFQPSFVTTTDQQLRRSLEQLQELQDRHTDIGPLILGAHLEGPYLAPRYLGAHDPRLRRDPDRAAMLRLLDAGPVSQVTLAPELHGALELIELLVAREIVVSLGHTDATAAQASAAAACGASAVTHLFNAMRPLHHREPGIVGWALASPDVHIELIVDGHHVHQDVVRTVWRVAADRIVLVTDGTAASGMPDGTYRTGTIELTASHGAVRNEVGALAGSALTMIDAVRNVHALGVPLPTAVAAATSTPARLLDRTDVGRLQVGGPAHLTVLDDRLAVRETLVAGRTVYAA